MGFICPIRLKLSLTHPTLDFLQLVRPNIFCSIATTTSRNTEFSIRIAYKVGPMITLIYHLLTTVSLSQKKVKVMSVMGSILHLVVYSTNTKAFVYR